MMNSDREEFEALRKLMALKRHEQPPPGYLNHLPARIIARIERGEGQSNFWEKISMQFSLRPSLAYAFGLTACGALGLSAVFIAKQEGMRTANSSSGVALGAPSSAAAYASQIDTETPLLHVAGWLRNTNPATIIPPQISLFSTSGVAIPVAYQTGGN